MKKLLILLMFVIVAQLSVSHANDLYGKYKSQPEISPGFKKPYSDEVKQAIKRLTVDLEITDKEIIVRIYTASFLFTYNYQIDGKYLLAKENDIESPKYVPFYIDDNGNLHGMNQIFYKTE